ncbi:MAG: hypothetical protein AAGU19_08125 [Prolixibacteraceae bacterium]
MQMQIKRGLAVIATVEIDESTVFSKKMMADHKIRAEFYASAPLPIQLGDYITVAGIDYFLNRLPELQKINIQTYKYSAEFEGPEYSLYNKLFLYDGLSEFDYTGSPEDFLTLIVGQINLIDPGWSVGSVDTADDINLTFSNVSCRQALTQVAEAFKMEYDVAGKAISLKTSIGTVTAHRFEYGRGNGLYKLTRVQVSDQNIVTRVYGFGGSTNISADYRDRAKKLIFESRYLEANTALYGVIEGVFNDEKIFPKRTGTLSAVHVEYDTEGNYNPTLSYVEDTTIDFDLNAYLISGQTAKIVFKSGDLSGQEFEIWKHDHATKRIYFNVFDESDGYPLPNSLNLPAIGNTYTLVNISMPAEYITAAETALQAATQAYLDQNSVPMVTYNLEIDPKYIKENSIALKVGDLVTIYDAALGIDKLIRVLSLEYPLVNPNKIKATISDTVLYTTSERVILEQAKQKRNVVTLKRQSIETARRNTTSLKTLRDYLLDSDNEFDQDLITAKRIAALLIESGTSAGNFLLHTPVPTFLDNYGGDANAFLAPACTLSHLEVSILIAGVESANWAMAEGSFASLTPATAYYLYAKCSKTQATGVWVLSSEAIASDQEGFYYFPAGTLLPVDAKGVRAFVTMYGKTWINAGTIITGKLQDVSENNFIDLDAGTFQLGGIDHGITEADVTTLQDVKINGVLMSNMVFAALAYIENLGVKYLKTADIGQRIFINGADGSLSFYDASDNLIMQLAGGTMKALKTLIGSGDSTAGLIIENGDICAKGDNLDINDAGSGTWTPYGMISGTKHLRVFGGDGIYGDIIVDIYPTGIMFNQNNGFVKVNGVVSSGRPVARLTETTQLTNEDEYIVYAGASNATLTLPANPTKGKEFMIMCETGVTLTVDANGKTIKYGENSTTSSFNIPSIRDLYCLKWDTQYWQYHWMGR